MYISQNGNRGGASGNILARDTGRIESRHNVALARGRALDLRDYRGTACTQRGDEIARLGRAIRLGNDRHRRHDGASRAHFDAFGGVNVVEHRAHDIPLLARRILSMTSNARREAIISRAASTPSFRDAALPPT